MICRGPSPVRATLNGKAGEVKVQHNPLNLPPPPPPPPATLQTRGQTPGAVAREEHLFSIFPQALLRAPTALMQVTWPILERLPGQPGL